MDDNRSNQTKSLERIARMQRMHYVPVDNQGHPLEERKAMEYDALGNLIGPPDEAA